MDLHPAAPLPPDERLNPGPGPLPPRRLRRTVALGWPILLGLGIVAWFAWPFLHPDYVGYDGDSMFLFLPALRLVRQELLAGRLPLWNPGKFLGAPLLADLMVPLFYPPQLLALLLPQPLGLHVLLVAHYVLAGVGAYALARRGFGASPAGALLAGLTFALGASLTMQVAHPNQLYATAWLPLVWLAALSLARGAGWRRGALGLALTLGMQMLAGQPQIVFYSAVLIGWSVLFGLVRARGRRGPLLAGLAVGGALAGALAAVHWLPAWELSRLSFMRQARGDAFAMSFSLPWRSLLSLLWPGALGASGVSRAGYGWNFTEAAVYLGQASLLLALLGLVAGRRKPAAWLLGLVALSGLLLALGGNTPLYRPLIRLIPPLLGFRAPARAFCLTALALALLAGLGLDRLGAAARPSRRALLVAALIGLELAGLGFFRFHLLDFRFTSQGVLQTRGLEEVIRAASARPEEPGRLFRLAEEIDYNDAAPAAVQAKLAALQPDANSLHGLRMVDGYDEGMLPLRHWVGLMRHFWSNLFVSDPDSRLLGLLGVEFLLCDRPIYGAAWQPVGTRGGITVYRNHVWRGEVFTRAHWPELDFTRLTGLFASVERAKTPISLLREGPVAQGAHPPPIAYRRTAPGEVQVRLPEGFRGELLLSEGWMPGWWAEAEGGVKIAGHPLNAALIAFELPPGLHRLRLAYAPPLFRQGAALSAAALLLLLALGLWPRRRRGAMHNAIGLGGGA